MLPSKLSIGLLLLFSSSTLACLKITAKRENDFWTYFRASTNDDGYITCRFECVGGKEKCKATCNKGYSAEFITDRIANPGTLQYNTPHGKYKLTVPIKEHYCENCCGKDAVPCRCCTVKYYSQHFGC